MSVSRLAAIASFHEDPAIVARWHAWAGRALTWFSSRKRRTILAAGAVVVAVTHPLEDVRDVRAWEGGPGPLGAVLVVVLLSAFLLAAWLAARRFAAWPDVARRHPQACLHGVFWSLLLVSWLLRSAPATHAILACLVVTVPFLLWRLGYMLMAAQRGRLAGSFFPDHLFHLWPAYGGSMTPYGKGPETLAACEARDELALARTQLAGLRLLLLAAAWTLAQEALESFVFGAVPLPGGGVALGLDLPRLRALIAGEAVPVGVAWSILYLELFHAVLQLAAKGHLVIGVLRLFGFAALRNTYKPLLAETVVEFWNRYFYYFKELLAVFFFYPVFARAARWHPTLRLFVAVFAAAFLGNMYYHLLDEERLLLDGDPWALWLALGPRLVYCVALALGIAVSMRRAQRRTAQPRRGLRRVAAILSVWTVFAVLHVWSLSTGTFAERTRLCLHLLGIG